MMTCLVGVAVLGFPALLSSPAPTRVHVHLVPHTHDDTGWLKTVDQYHTGSNNTIQHANVGRLISSVVDALMKDPARRFIYAEVAFFERWYRVQSNATKLAVGSLVSSGRLSFVNGGWCMHDEAAPHYVDMIDQTTLGHGLLLDHFGAVPRVGWQVDPFGHSATQAALLSAEAGFDGLFFGRIDYQDLRQRIQSKATEWVWRASAALGPDAQVFTGLTGSFGGNYGPPAGFCWDVKCNDEPIQDDLSLAGYNVHSRVADFVKTARWQQNASRGQHVLFTMGSDYQYEAAENWFVQLDKLIRHVNAVADKTGVSASYSSMDEYVAAKLAEQPKVTYPLKTDDMFPYADGPHMFWSGFFTSRPALKRYVRTSSSLLQTARQILLVSGMSAGADALLPLEEAIGVVQHHDAVTGTEMQHVAFDYAARIASGISDLQSILSKAVSRLTGIGTDWRRCELMNISLCDLTQSVSVASADAGARVHIAVYNPLAQEQTSIIALPVSSRSVMLSAAGSKSSAPLQITPSLWPVTNYDPDNRIHAAPLTAYFQVTLPPLGLKAFVLSRASNREKQSAAQSSHADGAWQPLATNMPMGSAARATPIVLENEFLQLQFDASGVLASVTNKATKQTVKLSQRFLTYLPHNATKDDHANDQTSGAYIFRPNGTATPVGGGAPTAFSAIGGRGDMVQEVRQTWAPWLNQSVRLVKGARNFELIVTAGELPLSRELITRLTTSLATNATFYTDANGREMQQRVRDFRPSWTLNQTEAQAGNYFPTTTAAYIRDETAQVTVLTDASQGAASLADGELEFMIHRRLVQDDRRGVSEPLNETELTTPYTYLAAAVPAAESAILPIDAAIGSGNVDSLVDQNGVNAAVYRPLGRSPGAHYGRGLIVRGMYKVSVEPPMTAASQWRPLMDSVYSGPQVFFGPSSTSSVDASESAQSGSVASKTSISGLQTALPANLQIVTLRALNASHILLRLGHQFGLDEDASLSKPASVDLAKLFDGASLRLASCAEFTLTANQNKAAALKRRAALKWKIEGESVAPQTHPWRSHKALAWDVSTVVTLGPLEIKTFKCQLVD